ncbi:DUF1491 family protein [Pseudothioclava nitratireducens]|uniref:DUF1491 family protein n=1 Tax=Pseudothioclava nitratireducens TaxID=1928646 RepID=UPI0023DB8A5F|nr:DUF1491 family protein [Defluviimonas nitratireducens]MDF1621654.1 DUF1491 family protein [Defluviimonas nitratireducens]
MSAGRLTADLWVRAYLKRLELAHIPAYVTRRGNADAGAVLVKCATLDGQARAYQRSFDLMTGAREWMVLIEGPEREVDDSVRKQISFDPDLWVIELESREGRTLLEEEGLKD